MHDQMAKHLLAGWFSTDAWKGFVFSTLIAGAGAAGHWYMSNHDVQHDQQSTLDQHTKQIADLSTQMKTTAADVTETKITTARIEGKLDVLGQKIDDDRHAKQTAENRK